MKGSMSAMEKKINDETEKPDKKKPVAAVKKCVMKFEQLEWYKPDLTLPLARRLALFYCQLAEKLPFYVVSLQMVAQAVWGLRSLPGEKSVHVKQVQNAHSHVKDLMEKMPGSRFLFYFRILGYRASVDDLDKANYASDKSVRDAARAAAKNANIHDRIDETSIARTEENMAMIEKIEQRKRDAHSMDKIGRAMVQRMLAELVKKKV